MGAELATNYDFSPQAYRAPLRLVESQPPQSELERLVTHFDQNWEQEGLPQDWYNLGKVGFSMDSQLALLKGSDPESKRIWFEQTERDIKGFVVEYLQSGLVHPSFYERVEDEKGPYFEDLRYHKAMPETVSAQERNGVVKQVISQVHDEMLNDGGARIITSPKGWTGLKTDRGIPIEYPYTFFYIFTGDGPSLRSVGIETDFSLSECRQVISRLTGQILPESASIEDYVKAVARISPEQGIKTPEDLVNVLQKVRKSESARDGKKWSEIYQDLGRLSDIYTLGEKADSIIGDFGSDVFEGDNSELKLRKKLAVTMLRLSKHYLDPHESKDRVVKDAVMWPEEFQRLGYSGMSYGQVLDEVERIPGCAGGGTGVESITDRLGVTPGFKFPEDKYGSREVECPNCHEIVIRQQDKLVKTCSHCGSDKISCK